MQNNNLNNSLGSSLNLIKQDLVDYLNLRLGWLKISYQEQFSRLISAFLFGILVTSVIFIILFFSLIGLALFIGRLLDDSLLGFAVLSGLSLIVLLVLILFRSRIKDYILNKSVSFIVGMDKDEDDDINENQENATQE